MRSGLCWVGLMCLALGCDGDQSGTSPGDMASAVDVGGVGGASGADATRPAVDRGPATPDRGPATPDRGLATPDQGPATPDQGPAAPDRGPSDAAAGPDAGSSPCVEQATARFEVEAITMQSWARDRAEPARVPLIVEGTPCGALTARAADPMVGAALVDGAARVWLEPEALRSGRRTTQVEVGVTGQPPLATLEVRLDIWAAAPLDASRHALLIGIDGMRSDAFQVARTPNMDRLARAGDWTVEGTTQLEGTTLSGPGWGSILSGVEVGKHGVVDNGDVRLDAAYPSFLARLRQDLEIPTAGALQWAPLLVMVGPDALDDGTTGNHDMVVANMRIMLQRDFRALFIHFDDVDHAGHAHGFAVDVPQYIEAIERVDAAIGELMDTILERPSVADESWLIVTTTDHGGRGTSHGPRDRENRRIPFIVSGPTVVPGTMGGASHTDAPVTVLAHMGYPLDPSLGLDGRVRGLAGEFSCDDDIDDDGDRLIDCDDPDCAVQPVCGGVAHEVCANARDDDRDGLTDCADDDCAEDPACNVVCAPIELGDAVGRAVFADDIAELPAVTRASCGGDGPEVALTWTAPADDVYLFDTFGSDFDTVLALREGDCVGPELACNDQAFGSVRLDTPLPAQSAIRLPLVAGQALTLVIDAGPLGGGAAELDITRMSAACPDADLGEAVGQAIAEGDTRGARTRYLGSCAGTARDALYRWTAPAAGDYVFDTFGSDFDTVLMVMDGACGEEERACNDDAQGLQSSVTIEGAEAGEVFTIVVSGFRGRAGEFRLNAAGPQ